jgi:hypothetical protein
MRKISLLSFCLSAFSVISLIDLSFASYASTTQGSLTPMQHTLVTPLALAPGFAGAQIAVANRTDLAIPAVVDFVDETGHSIVSDPITIGPHQIQSLDFTAELRGAELSNVRSVTVTYYGVFRSLASQVELLGFKGGGSADATPYENVEFYSPHLNAVWWSPHDSTAYIAITNSSQAVQSVRFNVDDHSSTISLPPEGTVLREVPSDQSSNDFRSAHIESSAPNGTIRATAFVATSDGSYINTLRFVDPGVLMSGSLAATGIILKDGSYVMPVVNLTGKDETISGHVFLRRHDSLFRSPLPISPIVLHPGQISSVTLESVHIKKDDIVAVKLDSSGGPGSFLASLTVLYPKKPLLSSSVPFRDVATEEMATGGYPWIISGDYQSTVYLTNTTRQKKTVSIRLFPSDGSMWVPAATVLQPGETAEYNIRNIRDQQVPDGFGHTLNKTVSSGQFIWGIEAHATDEGGLLGRTVMESMSDKTLRSYSCYSCSCGYAVTGISVNPYQFTVPQGNSFSFTTVGHYYSPCLVNSPYTAAVIPSALEVSNPSLSVLARGNPSTILAASQGSANFTAHYFGGNITFNQGSCPATYYDVSSGGQATVSPYSTITVRSTQGASLTPGDNLTFSGYACMHTLGSEQCPALWGINVEVVATVPDNVANWTISQQILSGIFKGTLKDVNTGATSPLTSPQQVGPDGPYSGVNLQQVAGATTMYYVDDPGVLNVRFGSSQTEVIDSGTLVLNFETRLCNNNQQSACTVNDWYEKVVISPGGQLDQSQTLTGPGSTSVNF